ncbi:MAG TPA: hypothetical protein VFY93_14420 [Planctomycetota bacterium]|nr:hypothetical protein [Planctomycetota bacterium]
MGLPTRRLVLVAALATGARAETVEELRALLDTDRAGEAALKLADLGPAAREAVPQLTRILASPDYDLEWRAAWALSRIGPDAVAAAPALAEQFGAKFGLPRTAARIALIRIGRRATGAIVESMAKAPERYEQGAAEPRAEQAEYLNLLLDLDAGPEAAVPAVLKLLDNGAARDEALTVLARLGPRAAAALPVLAARFRGLGDKDSAEAHALLDTMVAFGEPSVATLAELAQASLTDERRGNVIGALACVPGAGVSAAKTCLEATAIRTELEGALWHVAKAGPYAADLVPLLEPRIARWEAPPESAAALLALGAPGKEALERLIFKTDSRLRTRLAKQLAETEEESTGIDFERGAICPLAVAHPAEVVPLLVRLGHPNDPANAKEEVLLALAVAPLGGQDARGATILAGLHLKGDSVQILVAACRLAGSLGPSSLADRLKPLVKHQDENVRVAAAVALHEIGKGGPKEADVIGTAVAAAVDAGDEVRIYRLADSLWRAGPLAKPQFSEAWKALVPRLRPPGKDFGADAFFASRAAARMLACMLPGLSVADRGQVLAALKEQYSVAETVAWNLGRAGDFDSLATYLPSHQDAVDVAIRGVRACRVDSRKALTARLSDGDPMVRQFAARCLLRIDPAKAGDQALLLALGDTETCLFEDDLLAEYRKLEPSPAPVLRNGLASENAILRHRCAVMLGALGDRDAIPAMRAILEDQGTLHTRVRAVEVLDALLAQ